MQSRNLADHLQIWGVDGDWIVFADGSIGFGFGITGMDPGAEADDAMNGYGDQLKRFLNSIPTGTSLQFIQNLAKCGGAAVAGHRNLASLGSVASGDAGVQAAALAEARCLSLESQANDGQIPDHQVYLIARVPAETDNEILSGNGRGLKGIWQTGYQAVLGGRDFAAVTDKAYQKQLASSARVAELLQSGLAALGLRPRRLKGGKILEMIYEQWNPGREVDLGRHDPEDIRSSLLFTDVGIGDVGFQVGEHHHRILSLKVLPEQTWSGMAGVLQGLPFDSRLFVSIYVPDQMKEMDTLQTQRRVAYSMAFGKRSGVGDIESTAKFNDLEALLDEMIGNGERVYQCAINVVLRAQNQDMIKNQVAQVLGAMRELGGAEAMQETVAAFDIFSQVALPNARATERIKRVKSSNLADLLPVYQPWVGHDVPRVLLRSRRGTLMTVDPFDYGLTNANQLISGASGAGKSFLTNILLLQMLKENPRVFFVDIGGSYRKLCENLGGQYVNLVAGSDMAINPFDLLPNEVTPSPSKIKFLVGLVEIMTKEHDEAQLPRLERAEIEQAIIEVYRSVPRPRLSDLRELLLTNQDPAVTKHGRILGPWCGETPFGRIIDGETTVRTDSRLIAFDLKGMEAYPDLQAVVLYIITDLVWREVQRDRSGMKFLVFDECWKLLKSDAGIGFIEEVFRTFRKYHASAIAISQDIDDFAKSKISGAILANCALKWVLLQPQGDKGRLRDVLALNDTELALVSSLTQEKGVYSEAFLMAGTNRVIAVVEATPLELWIATTDPRDLAKIDDMTSQRPDTSRLDILRDLAARFPHGMAAAP